MKLLRAVARSVTGALTAAAVVLVVFGILCGLSLLSVQLDLVFHPFLREIHPAWWNIFTTEHGLTIAWIYFRPMFFVLNIVGALILSLVIGAYAADR